MRRRSINVPICLGDRTSAHEDAMYTMDDYVKALNAEDYPNAIAIWDALADLNDRFIRTDRGKAFNNSLPPIISSFMPKSGGTFLFNRMIQTFGYTEFHWGVTRANSFTEVYPVGAAVDVYSRGGYFCHSHALPQPYFRMVMAERATGPIWVHVRHPAETCLAGFFHFRGQGQGDGDVAQTRMEANQAQKEYLKSAHGFEFKTWNDFFLEHWPFYAGWLTDWSGYADEKTGRVFFTFFEEMADVDSLFTRVFAHYGRNDALPAVAGPLPQDRRRTSGQRNWREGLGAEALAMANDLDDLWREFRAKHFKTESP
jgi:hypothetical protein